MTRTQVADDAVRALSRFPRAPLGDWPTQVERLAGLDVPSGCELWVKREDLSSRVYGGNKVRKLELLLAASGGEIVTFGGLASNHVYATAVHAASLGRPCVGVLLDQPLTDGARAAFDRNRTACRRVLRPKRPGDTAAALGLLASHFARSAFGREGGALVGPGGSSPLGTLGWVAGGLELAEQIARGDCPKPDEVYVAYGSGGTAVGLALGLALAGVSCEVVAVRVATKLAGNTRYARSLGRRTLDLLFRGQEAPKLSLPRLTLEHGFVGRGYGHPTPEGEEAVAAAARVGLLLEPTYTGKAFAALLAAAREKPSAKTRMFLDTYSSADLAPHSFGRCDP